MAHRFPGLGQAQVVRVSNAILSKGSPRDQLTLHQAQPIQSWNQPRGNQTEFIWQITETWLGMNTFYSVRMTHSFIIPPQEFWHLMWAWSSPTTVVSLPTSTRLRLSVLCSGGPWEAFCKMYHRWVMTNASSSSTKLSAPEGTWRSICSLPPLQPPPVTRRCSSTDSAGIYWAPTVYQVLLWVL